MLYKFNYNYKHPDKLLQHHSSLSSNWIWQWLISHAELYSTVAL